MSLAHSASINTALREYERLMRPVVVDKQQVAPKAVRWFRPRFPCQLRVRRAALRLARLPVLDRYLAALIAGKSIPVVISLAAGARHTGSNRTPEGHSPVG